jgi:hypothetical protein
MPGDTGKNSQITDGSINALAAMSMTAIDEQNIALFSSLCQFIWVQGDPLPLIYNPEHHIYVSQGINPSSLDNLRSTGLIFFERGGFVKRKFGKHTRLFYFGKPTKIQFSREMGNELDIGQIVLTEKGKALAARCKGNPNHDFYHYVIECWSQQGLITSSILPRR